MTCCKELLEKNKNIELLRFVTTGSIDDGKSTLIGRLLYDCKCIYRDQFESIEKDCKKLNRVFDFALLTDGLKAEREQGITIDVAYRYFSTKKRRFIIMDTPGHEQYIRNMATGASLADVAIILVDAAKGILLQTKVHAFILSLLGIKKVILAINKMDLICWNNIVFDKIVSDFNDFCKNLGFIEVVPIPISALNGDNVVYKSKNARWYNGVSIIEYLENVSFCADSNLEKFRFPVQLVSRPNQEFRGYMGRIASGIVRIGDDVIILPSMRKSKVTSIMLYDKEIQEAYAPMSVMLTIKDEIDISRGSIISNPDNMPVMDNFFDANIICISDKNLRVGDEFLLKHLYSIVKVIIEEIRYVYDSEDLSKKSQDYIGINQIGCVRLRTYKDIIFDKYEDNKIMGNFILISKDDNNTAAAGMILNNIEKKDSIKSNNIEIVKSKIEQEQRAAFLGHKSATIWFVGLSGSGKSTIAMELELQLFKMGCMAFVFDGDNIRFGLNSDLGFSIRDREENLRRTAEAARLYNMSGGISIVSFITPLEKSRKLARKIIGDNYIEVYLDVPVEICKERDPKGLYKKAINGSISEFTGISSPFEVPSNPDIIVDTSKNSIEESVKIIINHLKFRNII